MNSAAFDEDRLRQLRAVDAGLRQISFLPAHLQRLQLLSRESGREALAGALLQKPSPPPQRDGGGQGRHRDELEVIVGRAKLQHAQQASRSIQQLQAQAERLFLERSRLEQRLHALAAAGDDQEGFSFLEALQADEQFDRLDSRLVLAELRSDMLQQPGARAAARRQRRLQLAAMPGAEGEAGPGPALHSAQATSDRTLEILERVVPQLRRQQQPEQPGQEGAGAAAAPLQVLPAVLLGQEQGGEARALQLKEKLELVAQELQSLVPEQEQLLQRHRRYSQLLQLRLRALSGGRYDGGRDEGAEAQAAEARAALRAALQQRPVALAVAQAAVEHLLDRALLLANMRPTMDQVGGRLGGKEPAAGGCLGGRSRLPSAGWLEVLIRGRVSAPAGLALRSPPAPAQVVREEATWRMLGPAASSAISRQLMVALLHEVVDESIAEVGQRAVPAGPLHVPAGPLHAPAGPLHVPAVPLRALPPCRLARRQPLPVQLAPPAGVPPAWPSSSRACCRCSQRAET
jgi:hypothetical protein